MIEVIGHLVRVTTLMIGKLESDVAICQPMFLEIAWFKKVSESEGIVSPYS